MREIDFSAQNNFYIRRKTLARPFFVIASVAKQSLDK